jgi:hypothetical protein
MSRFLYYVGIALYVGGIRLAAWLGKDKAKRWWQGRQPRAIARAQPVDRQFVHPTPIAHEYALARRDLEPIDRRLTLFFSTVEKTHENVCREAKLF